MKPVKILITGANGQIGQVLTEALREKYGVENVLATDIQPNPVLSGPYEVLNILDKEKVERILLDYEITQIYHLAALLSASGEKNPLLTWDINLNGLMYIMELSVKHSIDRIFYPSTIAVFGQTTPKVNTAQNVPLMPETVYGISKVSGELLANYYSKRYNLDIRSIRYPGIISYQSIPAGGTTDYAVEIFYYAKKYKKYESFLDRNTRLPMMFISDAIKATIDLMEASSEDIGVRTSYNLTAMSFTPEEIAKEIQKHIPDFEITYKPDFRQEIAETWSESIDDTAARNDWKWQEKYDLEKMVKVMLDNVDVNKID